MTASLNNRNNDLAAIHVMAAQLGMDASDRHPASEYRSTLFTVGGPSARRGEEISAAYLDHVGRSRVKAHLQQLCKARGINNTREIGRSGDREMETSPSRPHALTPSRPGRPTPSEDRVPMLRKIRAMLYEAGRQDAYADGLAKRMFHVDMFEWLQPEQMRRLVAALCYDRGRRRMREAREAERKGHNMADRMEV